MVMINQSYQDPNQVYYDADKGQYYTSNSPLHNMQNPFLSNVYQTMNPDFRNYIGNPVVTQNTQANDMIARARAAVQNWTPPQTASQMFPSLSMGNYQAPMGQTAPQAPQSMGMGYGAGRFLGGTQGILAPSFNFSAPTATK